MKYQGETKSIEGIGGTLSGEKALDSVDKLSMGSRRDAEGRRGAEAELVEESREANGERRKTRRKRAVGGEWMRWRDSDRFRQRRRRLRKEAGI